jgi:hypothetical protein
MRAYLIFLVCLIVLVSSVSAQAITWTAPPEKAAVNIYIVSNEGTTGSIIFYFADGSSKTGSWSYLPTAEIWDYSFIRRGTLTLGSNTEHRDFVTPGQFYTMFYHVPGVANVTSNRLSGYMDQSKISFWPAVEIGTPASPIIKFSITANQDVEVWEDIVDREAQKGMLAASNDDWIAKIMNLATSTFWSGYNFVKELAYWVQFFFIDNLGMIVALFLAVPMAFAAKNSRGNPEKFLREYFKTLKGFFEFILSLWRMLLESIGTIRGWFRV